MQLLAVGPKLPAWADQACADYAKRLPKAYQLVTKTVAISRQGSAAARQREEGEALDAAIPKGNRRIVLDERGELWSSAALAAALARWADSGHSPSFLLGGPDGHGEALRDSADHCWSLSPATLPHALARVVVCEQLYRAWTMVSGHPYHRG